MIDMVMRFKIDVVVARFAKSSNAVQKWAVLLPRLQMYKARPPSSTDRKSVV